MKELFDKINLFVLDMDGTFYLGENRIDGALEFIQRVRETGREFVFFTNNSSKNGAIYVEKLRRMGYAATEKDIMTSGDVTVEYLKTNYPGGRFIWREPRLWRSFLRHREFVLYRKSRMWWLSALI